jgi:hypothetical protein
MNGRYKIWYSHRRQHLARRLICINLTARLTLMTISIVSYQHLSSWTSNLRHNREWNKKSTENSRRFEGSLVDECSKFSYRFMRSGMKCREDLLLVNLEIETPRKSTRHKCQMRWTPSSRPGLFDLQTDTKSWRSEASFWSTKKNEHCAIEVGIINHPRKLIYCPGRTRMLSDLPWVSLVVFYQLVVLLTGEITEIYQHCSWHVFEIGFFYSRDLSDELIADAWGSTQGYFVQTSLQIELNNWLLHMLHQSIKVSLIAVSVEQLIYLFLTRFCLLPILSITLQRHHCPLGRQNYFNKDGCGWGSRVRI